jgi:hypothetical protein
MELSKRNHRRDLEVVFLRENKKWTYPQIAKRYNITKVRARQVYIRTVNERKNVNKQMGIGA